MVNIVKSIEMSRKTILVLSNNFARSKWAEMEMSLAQNKLLTTRRYVLHVLEGLQVLHISVGHQLAFRTFTLTLSIGTTPLEVLGSFIHWKHAEHFVFTSH